MAKDPDQVVHPFDQRDLPILKQRICSDIECAFASIAMISVNPGSCLSPVSEFFRNAHGTFVWFD